VSTHRSWGWHPWDDAQPKPPSPEGPGELLGRVLPRWWPSAGGHHGLGAGERPQLISSQGAVAGGLSSLGGQHWARHLLGCVTTQRWFWLPSWPRWQLPQQLLHGRQGQHGFGWGWWPWGWWQSSGPAPPPSTAS